MAGHVERRCEGREVLIEHSEMSVSKAASQTRERVGKLAFVPAASLDLHESTLDRTSYLPLPTSTPPPQTTVPHRLPLDYRLFILNLLTPACQGRTRLDRFTSLCVTPHYS